MKLHRMPSVSAALLLSATPRGVIGRIRNDADGPVRQLLGEVKNELNRIGSEVRTQVENHAERLEKLETRQTDIEQSSVSRRRGGGAGMTWGQRNDILQASPARCPFSAR